MNRYADWRLDCFETGTTHQALTTRLSWRFARGAGAQMKQYWLPSTVSEWRGASSKSPRPGHALRCIRLLTALGCPIEFAARQEPRPDLMNSVCFAAN